MATAEELPILLKNDDRAGPGILHLQAYDRKDRIKRAAKAWAGFWVLAVLSVPLIGLHWFLVPGFLIAGPVSAYRRLHAMTTADKATGRCPACNNDITIKLEPKEQLELWKYCPTCNSPLHLVESGAAQAPDAAANA